MSYLWIHGPNALFAGGNDAYGPMSGQIIAAFQALCKSALSARSLRLMEAVYSVEMQCTGQFIAPMPLRAGPVGTRSMLSDCFHLCSGRLGKALRSARQATRSCDQRRDEGGHSVLHRTGLRAGGRKLRICTRLEHLNV